MRCRYTLVVLCCCAGCHSLPSDPLAITPPTMGTPQPQGPAFLAPGALAAQQAAAVDPNATRSVFIPVTNEDYAWEVIVDVVDDYFPQIEQENRVQLVGNVVTEGRIVTYPQVGATLLEPNHIDSVGRYNLVESTFQTVRRRAEIRVLPQQGGYQVEAIVHKEFEDLPRPENATAGTATYRFDNSLNSRLGEEVSRSKLSNFWVPMGRDCEVETAMLNDIQYRIQNPPN